MLAELIEWFHSIAVSAALMTCWHIVDHVLLRRMPTHISPTAIGAYRAESVEWFAGALQPPMSFTKPLCGVFSITRPKAIVIHTGCGTLSSHGGSLPVATMRRVVQTPNGRHCTHSLASASRYVLAPANRCHGRSELLIERTVLGGVDDPPNGV